MRAMTTPTSPSAWSSRSSCPARPSRCGTRSPPRTASARGSCPTDLDERVGGAVVFHMGEDTSRRARSPAGTRRAASTTRNPTGPRSPGTRTPTVTPLVTEFLVEAQSGGTCVLRVVQQRVRHRRRLGAGVLRRDGEGLDAVLRQPPAVPRRLPGPAGDVHVGRRAGRRLGRRRCGRRVRKALGAQAVGDAVDARRARRQRRPHRRGSDGAAAPRRTLRCPGYLGVLAYDMGDGKAIARVEGYLFSDDAPAYVEREARGMEGLARRRSPCPPETSRSNRRVAMNRAERGLTHMAERRTNSVSGALAIETDGLVKVFGETRAVDGIDLRGAAPAPSTACSARTARARRRRSGCSPRCSEPDAGSARVLGHDVVTDADAVRGCVSLTGQFASVDEELDGRENLVLLGRLLGFSRRAVGRTRRRAARRVRPRRRGRQARVGVLGRHAAATRHRRQHRRHAASCCSSTSRRPDSTRAAATRSGTSCACSSRPARRCCSRRSTSTRPTSSPTASRSSTTAR